MSNSNVFGEGIIKSSARPLAVYVDNKGNEYICDKDCIDVLDPRRSFEEQSCAGCDANPFDFGG